MRFDGTLGSWNDDRGFGFIHPVQGGEPIFVHIKSFPASAGRPQPNQSLSFELKVGPKGKRARNVQLTTARRRLAPSDAELRAQWGTATLFAIPAFLLVYVAVAVLWRPPLWIAAVYLLASLLTFAVYADDKSAARKQSQRTSENTLHASAIAGGWPGALLAQQFLRHKTTKSDFRSVFWATVVLNVAAFVFLLTGGTSAEAAAVSCRFTHTTGRAPW